MMFCPNCGQQIPEGSIFCPACGANLQYQAPVEPPVNLEDPGVPGVAATIRAMLASSKFLAMCIIVTIATLLSGMPVVSMDEAIDVSSSFDLFGILSTIAMWITYAKAKSTDTIMSITGLKFSAGIATATWVINWIGVAVFFVCGIIFVVAGPLLTALFEDSAFMEEFNAQLKLNLGGMGLEGYEELFNADMIGIFITVFAVVFIVGAVVALLLNIFYYGKVKNFARNLHVSYITNKVTDLRFSTISNWFMVLGVMGIIGSLSSLVVIPTVGLSAILSAVNLIIASTWVKELSQAVAAIPMPIELNSL